MKQLRSLNFVFLLLIIASFLLYSINSKKGIDDLTSNDSLVIKYVEGFKVFCFRDYKQVINNLFSEDYEVVLNSFPCPNAIIELHYQ